MRAPRETAATSTLRTLPRSSSASLPCSYALSTSSTGKALPSANALLSLNNSPMLERVPMVVVFHTSPAPVLVVPPPHGADSLNAAEAPMLVSSKLPAFEPRPARRDAALPMAEAVLAILNRMSPTVILQPRLRADVDALICARGYGVSFSATCFDG